MLTYARFAVALGFSLVLLQAGQTMPPKQQNALVAKYCTVCHTDIARNGGLSLQHFDAAHVAPSLAAMMVSKLASGASIATALAASSSPEAAVIVDRKMKGGAMGAAGLGVPDKPTVDALIHALAKEAEGATNWYVERAGQSMTASILREVPSPGLPGEARSYRLLVGCNSADGSAATQLAWSPVPAVGTLTVFVDSGQPMTFAVQGKESMGNGSSVMAGPAAVNLAMPLPSKTLRVTGLFAGEQIDFPFDQLPAVLKSCSTDVESHRVRAH